MKLALLGALTAVAFGLRLVGMDQSLFNDERFTYAIVSENGLGGVLREVYETSVTPPLHYVLAWLSVQLPGDDTVLVRLPSLVFGTAMIPLIFVFGRRVGGDRVGLLAAALLALSPFAIFYSNEARTYEVMVFLVTLSTLALLRAEEGGGRRWWAVYAVASCAVLWAHYTAVFVLAAQAGWAAWVHRERLRELALAEVAIVVGYLPWLPGFFEQRQNEGVDILNAFATRSIGEVFELPLRTLIGHPFLSLSDVPGTLGLLLVLGVAGLGLVAAVRRPAAFREIIPSLRAERGLVLLLALATPAGLLLYDAVGGAALFGARNLSASQPALFVLVALVLGSLASAVPARVAAPVLAGLLALLAVITVDSVTADNRRPPYRDAARYLDGVARGDAVVDLPPVLGPDDRLRQSSLELYFEREHPVYRFFQSAEAWRRGRAGRSVYVVSPSQEAVARATGLEGASAGLVARRDRLGGLDGRALARGSRTFAGFDPVTVRRFEGAVDGRLERRGGEESITWSLGREVSVQPGVARGEARNSTRPAAPMTVDGWALEGGRPTTVDWVLAFADGRLVAVSPGGGRRPDIATSEGASALLSGFALASLDPLPNGAAVRVFALVGDHASELPVRR